jgi:hypothetical protein
MMKKKIEKIKTKEGGDEIALLKNAREIIAKKTRNRYKLAGNLNDKFGWFFLLMPLFMIADNVICFLLKRLRLLFALINLTPEQKNGLRELAKTQELPIKTLVRIMYNNDEVMIAEIIGRIETIQMEMGEAKKKNQGIERDRAEKIKECQDLGIPEKKILLFSMPLAEF